MQREGLSWAGSGQDNALLPMRMVIGSLEFTYERPLCVLCQNGTCRHPLFINIQEIRRVFDERETSRNRDAIHLVVWAPGLLFNKPGQRTTQMGQRESGFDWQDVHRPRELTHHFRSD